jgi:lactoylglutathione lyase
MAIAHVALWAHDLDRVCAFYESLGATRGVRYDNSVTGFSSFFLSWPGSDVRLEVMHRPDLAPAPVTASGGWAHVALALGSEAAVDEAAAALAARGVPVLDGPRRTGDGYYECVVADPEGNRVELTA